MAKKAGRFSAKDLSRFMAEKKIKPPDDYVDEWDFLSAMRRMFQLDIDADKQNREAALDDSRFFVGYQWPDHLRQKRDRGRKPVLTFNRLVAFVAIVLGNRRLNETVIKIVPDNGGTKAVARVRQGLIRQIQKISKAEIAYNKANENQVICGIGNFQVHLDYCDDDVFDQDIKIAAIPNALAVIWDRQSVDPTGADAEHVFVVDTIPVDVFRDKYSGKVASDVTTDTVLLGDLKTNGWITTDTVRVVSYWRLRRRKKTLALINTGEVHDITNANLDEIADTIVTRKDGSPVIRDVEMKYAEMYVASGASLLEGPYELPIPRVPVFRVPGWEINVGEEKHRWGLVRFLKDPMRLHNYWRSIIAEKLMQAPKQKWIASQESVAGREKEWRESHLSDDNLLVFNGEAGAPPTQAQPVQMEQALIAESVTNVQDIKDISNLHEANLGDQSNEVSGKAIVARQRVGELGTVIYLDNLNLAIEECGRVINYLIPLAYDGPRVIKILGPDDTEALQVINDPEHPESIDITLGKYSVSVTTGPSFVTKRIEAAESMLNLINAMPQVMSVAADKIVEAQDWPGADEIARRLRLQLPPGLVDTKDMTPQQLQAQQQAAQVQAQQMQMQNATALAALQKLQAETAQIRANVDALEARAEKDRASIGIQATKVATEAGNAYIKNHLDASEHAHADATPEAAPAGGIDDQIKAAQLRKLNAQADESEMKARQAANKPAGE